jgi:hypothetical protein
MNILEEFHIPEYKVKGWYDKKRTEKWVAMFSDVKFYDERNARPFGEYPNLAKIWEHATYQSWSHD